jgi:integrase
LAGGKDPSVIKRLSKTLKGITFDAIAAELIEKKRREQKAERTLGKLEWLLGIASRYIGGRPISEIAAPEILSVLRAPEKRGNLEKAKRLRAAIGAVFRYAIATGRAETDPTSALRGAIASPVVKHRPAITDLRGFGALLRAIASYVGTPETRAALELLALTFTRPGELRSAKWKDFDLEAAVWTIPAEVTKMRRPHRVPLARRSIEILEALRAVTGEGQFVFPSLRSRDRCMSENTINAALRRLGFSKDEMCAHGFRSAASSLLNESGEWNSDAIERQTAFARRKNHRTRTASIKSAP